MNSPKFKVGDVCVEHEPDGFKYRITKVRDDGRYEYKVFGPDGYRNEIAYDIKEFDETCRLLTKLEQVL